MRGRFWIATGLLAATVLAGCAATQPLADGEKQAAYAAFRTRPFMPVNAFINSGDFVTTPEAEGLTYLARQLQDCGAFARVDVGVQRWPVTLDLHYEVVPVDGEKAASLARLVVAVGSLFLIPVSAHQMHTLAVEVFHGPMPVRKLYYSEPIQERLSLYDLADAGRGRRAGIDRLLLQFVNDLAAQGLLPRKPEAPTAPAADAT